MKSYHKAAAFALLAATGAALACSSGDNRNLMVPGAGVGSAAGDGNAMTAPRLVEWQYKIGVTGMT